MVLTFHARSLNVGRNHTSGLGGKVLGGDMEEHGGLGDSVGRREREDVQLYSSLGKHLVSDMGIVGSK